MGKDNIIEKIIILTKKIESDLKLNNMYENIFSRNIIESCVNNKKKYIFNELNLYKYF